MKILIHGGQTYTIDMIRLLDKSVRQFFNSFGSKLLLLKSDEAIVEIPDENRFGFTAAVIHNWNRRLCRMHWWNTNEDIYFDKGEK